MRKWTSVLAVFVAVMMIAASAFAQAGGSGGAGGAGAAGGASGPSGAAASGSSSTGASDPSSGSAPGTTSGDTAKGADTSKDSAPSASPATGSGATGTTGGSSMSSTTASADFTGRHTMEGEVVKVDQKKGHVTLKTAEGNMDLHFPASALQNVKKGDRISVEMAMKPAGQASTTNGKDKGSASPKTDTKSEKKY